MRQLVKIYGNIYILQDGDEERGSIVEQDKETCYCVIDLKAGRSILFSCLTNEERVGEATIHSGREFHSAMARMEKKWERT